MLSCKWREECLNGALCLYFQSTSSDGCDNWLMNKIKTKSQDAILSFTYKLHALNILFLSLD